MDVRELLEKTRAFITDEVLPLDDTFDGDIEAAGGESLRTALQARARDLGILSPHVAQEFGGLGLTMAQQACLFQEAGRSLFGPLALNIAAPDEGNMHLLACLADESQRERFLRPLIEGGARSAFAMTEPSPGAGSDPLMLRTEASAVPGGWLINGQKHLITGADGASFLIILARTSNEPVRPKATMFICPADTPGVQVGEHVKTSDRAMLGGHCVVRFTNAFVPAENVLGEVDGGFTGAQLRLGPARLTHVMRWLGAATRAHEAAVGYVIARDAFGSRLADLGMVQQMISDNVIDLRATETLLIRACDDYDAGASVSEISSVTKVFGSEALWRVVDRSVQMCGGLGVSAELPIAKVARELRAFRIYDGASEVHRMAIARRAVRHAEQVGSVTSTVMEPSDQSAQFLNGGRLTTG